MADEREILVPAELLWELLEHLNADEYSSGSQSLADDVRTLLGIPVIDEDRLDEDYFKKNKS
jgi:hypothetical protein